MLASAEPSARLRLVWRRFRSAARTAATVSGSSTSNAITTPTTATGAPADSTADSSFGDTVFASPTTEIRQTNSSPRLSSAVFPLGAAAW